MGGARAWFRGAYGGLLLLFPLIDLDLALLLLVALLFFLLLLLPRNDRDDPALLQPSSSPLLLSLLLLFLLLLLLLQRAPLGLLRPNHLPFSLQVVLDDGDILEEKIRVLRGEGEVFFLHGEGRRE